MKHVVASDYKKGCNDLHPVNDKTVRKYFDIYHKYVTGTKTQTQVAKEIGMSVIQMNRIIKWSAQQLQTDAKTNKQVIQDRIESHMQEIEDLKTEMEDPLGKLEFIKERRHHTKLYAEVSGAKIPEKTQGGAPQINIIMPDLQRPVIKEAVITDE